MTCFTCTYRPMCKIFNFIFENLKLDTNAIDYKEKFNQLYNTIGTVCNNYKEDKNNE
jgi:hypothetical protein